MACTKVIVATETLLEAKPAANNSRYANQLIQNGALRAVRGARYIWLRLHHVQGIYKWEAISLLRRSIALSTACISHCSNKRYQQMILLAQLTPKRANQPSEVYVTVLLYKVVVRGSKLILLTWQSSYMHCNLDIACELRKYPCTSDEHKKEKRSIRRLINTKAFKENKSTLKPTNSRSYDKRRLKHIACS